MGRSNVAAALAVAGLTLILIFHLIASWGLPHLDFLHLQYASGRLWKSTPHQRPLGLGGLSEGEPYLLGVGKADITGYDGLVFDRAYLGNLADSLCLDLSSRSI